MKCAFLVLSLSVAFVACAGIRVYPEYDKRIERDWAYGVTVVQGVEKKRLTVYNHCEKSALTGRTRGGDVNRRFCEFAFDGGPVRMDIAVCEDVQSYHVFPARLKLRNSFKNGVISVWLERPAMFGVRLNDYDKTILSIFAEAPESPEKIPQRNAPGVLYVDGWTDSEGEDGVTVIAEPVKEVYIAPGAVLNSRLVVRAKGAYIHGRGMMLDPMSDIFRFDQRKNARRGFLSVHAADVTVEDIKLVDSRTFNICGWGDNTIYRNVKALSSMMCSDGMTNGGRSPRVDGAWLYVGDNGLVVSGIKERGFYRNVAIGTSCNAIFPQGSNKNVTMENIDVFRADEGLVRNVYNGVLRRNTKWNELNSGEAQKEPGPQNLKHQAQNFFFKNLSAVDCVLFPRFFTGGNMGTLPKTFGFENVLIPWPTGSDSWKSIGKKSDVFVTILHDSAKYLDSCNYVVALTNFWVAGERKASMPEGSVKNPDRVNVSVAATPGEKPVLADRHEVGWICPFKRYIGASLQRDVRKVSRKNGEQRIAQPENGENLLADRPSTRSAWQRYPSWLVKFDAMTFDGDARIYRLTQCEKGAGMLNIVTDAFLRHGNGTYRLAFDARAKGTGKVPFEAHFFSNESQIVRKFKIANDGEWHHVELDVKASFDLAVTELAALFMKSSAPVAEVCFKNLSLVKIAQADDG